jgi:hypothetical protein
LHQLARATLGRTNARRALDDAHRADQPIRLAALARVAARQLGASLAVVAHLLGHKHVSTTSIYVHTRKRAALDGQERVSSLVAGRGTVRRRHAAAADHWERLADLLGRPPCGPYSRKMAKSIWHVLRVGARRFKGPPRFWINTPGLRVFSMESVTIDGDFLLIDCKPSADLAIVRRIGGPPATHELAAFFAHCIAYEHEVPAGLSTIEQGRGFDAYDLPLKRFLLPSRVGEHHARERALGETCTTHAHDRGRIRKTLRR